MTNRWAHARRRDDLLRQCAIPPRWGHRAPAPIVDEHFPMAGLTDPHEFYGGRGDDAELNRRMSELMDSVAKFGAGAGLDVVPTSRYFWTL